MNVLLKRAYESPAKTDGERILVDRLWPRGLAKVKAKAQGLESACICSGEWTLLACVVITIACFGLFALLVRQFGIVLLP